MDVCCKSTSINDLPPEILLQIFTLFVESEGSSKLYTILSKVSMAWRKVALMPSLWAEVTLDADDICRLYSMWEDTAFLEPISSIKTLNFSSHGESWNTEMLIVEDLEKFLKACFNLENFHLECCDSTRVINVLFNLPAFCPKITRLEIEQVPEIETAHVLLNWVEKYSINLTRLNLHCLRLKDCHFTALTRKIAECCPNLTHLSVSTDGLHDSMDLNAIHAGCPKLKELLLRNVSFTGIRDSTSCFLHLEKFCFICDSWEPHYTPLDMVWILKASKELKDLTLIGIDLQIENLLMLPCESLMKLCISNYDDNNHDLYNVLCQWKHSLRSIDIRCNKNSQDSLFRYIEKYGKESLESLSVVCFPPLKMQQIKRSLQQCAKLKFLRIVIYDYLTYKLFEDQIFLYSREMINEWLNH